MKRDMDLVRDILVQAETFPFGDFHDISVADHAHEEVVYHVMLLDEAGLIEAKECSSLDGIDWKAKRLTYEGHEFLDAARSNKLVDEIDRRAHARRAKISSPTNDENGNA
jgi:hypothetical protein